MGTESESISASSLFARLSGRSPSVAENERLFVILFECLFPSRSVIYDTVAPDVTDSPLST